MTIFYVCYDDLRKGSGGVRHIEEVVCNLRKFGHRIILFAPRPYASDYEPFVETIFIPIIRMRSLGFVSFNFLLCFYLIFFYFKFKPHLLYEREIDLTLIPTFISKFLSLPHIVEINALIIEEHKLSGTLWMKIWFMKLCQKLYLKLSDRLVIVSPQIRDDLNKTYHLNRRKMVVISNGANTDLFKPLDKIQCRMKLGLNPSAYYVGFVGAFYPWHGVDLLIESARKVLREMPNVNFILVGEGTLRQEMIRLVEKHNLENSFIFTGKVPYQSVPLYINSFDLGVALFVIKDTKVSGCPIKIFEYLACGKPVITTDVKGVKDIVAKSRFGLVVESKTPDKLAESIAEILSDEELKYRTASKAPRLIRSFYSWEITARKVERVCQEVVREWKRGFCYSE